MLGVLLPGMLALAQPAQVPKTNSTKVYMHYMPWFDAPQNPVPGQTYSWGWHWTMNTRNPNTIDVNGRRQIASHYYPLIGPYASADPHVVEYHLLLMKLSGVDGVLVDWYGSEGSNGDVGALLTNSNALINQTGATGVQFGLILEDRFWTNIQNARNSLTYARNNYFNKSNYIRHGSGSDPLVGVFGPITHQTPAAWTDILSYAGEDVEFLPLWYENADAGANADGEYAWIYSDYLTGLTNFYTNRAPGLKTAMGVAYPGFHDYYVEGGAGSSYFYIPENNGATLNETLNTYNQYKANLDFLQLATFNDFGEGTIFEPTVENGFRYLVRIQQYTGVPYTEADLQKVHRLYTLRKKYLNDAGKQAQLNTAFGHFAALRLNDAVAVMNAVDGTTPPPTGSSYYVRNRWQGTYLYDGGDRVRYSSSTSGATYQWVLEDLGNGQRELRNVGTGEYMHIENLTGYVQATARTSGWSSSRWVSEDAGNGYVRLRNVWQGSNYIHVENLAGHAQYGTINTAWESAQWQLVPVPVSARVAVSDDAAVLTEHKAVAWPTVTSDVLNIRTDGLYDALDIIDTAGKLRHSAGGLSGQNIITVDVSALPPGVHVVKLRGTTGVTVLRFIKQ